MSTSRGLREVAAGLVRRGGRLLVAQRRRGDTHPLKWEFPGGTVRPGETTWEAAAREIREELGLEVREAAYLGSCLDPPFRIHYHLADYVSGEVRLRAHEEARWVEPRELLGLDLLPGDRVLVERLIDAEGRGLTHV